MSNSAGDIQRPIRYRRVSFQLIIILGTMAVLVGIDFVAGYALMISTVRISAGQFRSEATRMPIRTRNLIPHTNHMYYSPYRGDIATNIPPGAPRVFRTDLNGTIKSGSNATAEPIARILFLGGSTTESNEVDEPFRFPAVVERLLNKYYLIPAEVWNGGVRGHTTVDSINLLLNNAAYTSATHVVLMHNINDRFRLSFQSGYQSLLGNSGETSLEKVTEASDALASAIFDFASYRSNLLFAVRMQFLKFHPFSGERRSYRDLGNDIDSGDPQLEQHALIYRTYTNAFIALSKTLNMVPILMTQPLARPSKEQDRFNDVLREVALAQHVKIIDLDRFLPHDREWLFLSDFIHMNNEGGETLGHIITGELSEYLGSTVQNEHYQPAPGIPPQ